MQQVRIKSVIGYAQGELAWFSEKQAAELVNSGAADYVVSQSNEEGSVAESGSPKTRAAESYTKKGGGGSTQGSASTSSSSSSKKRTGSKGSKNSSSSSSSGQGRNTLDEE